MIFLFIQASLSRYTLDFTSENMGTGKFFKFFIEPFDVVEVKLNSTFWTLFSSWEYAEKLYLTVTTEKSNQTLMEFGPYKSNLKITAIHFREYNYTVKLTSDSADEQTISLLIVPRVVDELSSQIFPSNDDFPFIKKYKETDGLRDQPDYPFYYDADSTSSNFITYSFCGFLCCYYLLLMYSDREFILKFRKKKE